MDINWDKVYEGTIKPANVGTDMWNDQSGSFELATLISTQKFNKKFDMPIRPVPWSSDFMENISITLEWLIRDHRNDTIRLSEDKVLNHIKDCWFRSEYYEGEYVHVCYPQELLKFRTEYDSVYDQLVNLSAKEMSSNCLKLRQRLKDLLWYQWKCLGKDGVKNKCTEKITYLYSCDRCGTDMPKAIKAYAILTQSKIKECIS